MTTDAKAAFRLPKDWIVEVEMTLNPGSGLPPYQVPVLLRGSDIAVECADLFKSPVHAVEFSKRFSAVVETLASKKLESGQVGKRPNATRL